MDRETIRKISSKDISRRDFIKAAGASALVGGLGALGGPKAIERITETYSDSVKADSAAGMATGSGNTYYISPNGSDSGNGSENSPWFSIEHAASQASSGDTIIVQDGTYEYGSNVQRVNQGNITIRAANGASPTMKWSGNALGWENTITEGLLIEDADRVTVDGIAVTDSHSTGLQLNGSANCTLRNIEAHHNGVLGIGLAFGTPDSHLINCVAHHNGVPSTATEGDGFQFNGASGDISGTLVENCDAYENIEDGYDCWDGYSITFRKCRAWNNGRPNSETPESTAMGIGFKMGGGEGGNNHAERCLAWGNHYAGFSDNHPANGCTVHNCTAWDNKRNFEFVHDGSELVNNIAYEGRMFDHSLGSANHHSNTWNLGIDNPQFRSTDPNSNDFLKLQDGSPCIDSGTEVNLDYDGSSPDLGAYEQGMAVGIGTGSQSTKSDGNSGDSREQNTLEISGNGDTVHYVFSVNGLIEAEDDNSEHAVFTNKATGTVTDETDIYSIGGEITSFQASGDLQITYKGEQMTVEELQQICENNS